MSKTVSKARAGGKKREFRIRNQKGRIRNELSPVMQKVKSLLHGRNAAWELHCLTGVSEISCKKYLSGDRPETLTVITKLLHCEHGRDVLFALMGNTSPAWFSKYRKSLDVNAAFKQLAEAERTIKRLQMEAAE